MGAAQQGLNGGTCICKEAAGAHQQPGLLSRPLKHYKDLKRAFEWEYRSRFAEGFSPTWETTKIGFVKKQAMETGTAGELEVCVNTTRVSKSGRENNSGFNEALKGDDEPPRSDAINRGGGRRWLGRMWRGTGRGYECKWTQAWSGWFSKDQRHRATADQAASGF